MNDDDFNVLYRRVLCMISAVWQYEDQFGFGNDNKRWAGPNGCDELFSHVLRLRGHFSRFDTHISLTEQSLQPYRLVLDAAWFSIMRSRFTETTSLLDMADEIQKGIRVPSDPNPEVKRGFERLQRIYQHHRGVFALHTNDPKRSLSHLQKFMDLTSALFGDVPHGKDQSMGVAWNELGNAHLQNDNVEEAEKCFLKSIDALRSMDGAQDIDISMPLVNLAFALWLKGSLKESADAFERAFEDRKKKYGIADKTSFA
jgi:hypothetical protein